MTGRPPKYPWSDWLASAEPVHVACDDWETDRRSLQMQAIKQAKKMGLRVSTRKCHRDENCLILHRGRRQPQDWNKLFDQRPHWVSYDSIRPTMAESFITLARQRAREQGLTLRVDRQTSELAMLIRAEPKMINTSTAAGEKLIAKYER